MSETFYSLPDVMDILVEAYLNNTCPFEKTELQAEQRTVLRERIGSLLDVAVNAGWRDRDLFESLLTCDHQKYASRIQSLAREAGDYCSTAPAEMERVFIRMFGKDVLQFIQHRPMTDVDRLTRSTLLPRPHTTTPTQLRNPVDHHFNRQEDGIYWYSVEATVMVAAMTGYDEEHRALSSDGGANARRFVDRIMDDARASGYSRASALDTMLRHGPFDIETLAALEHWVDTIGATRAHGVMQSAFTELQS